MGWLFYADRRVKTYADEKAEITRLCTFESDAHKTVLLKACKVGSTWYAAAKVTNIDGSRIEDSTYVTDEGGSITFGAIFLTRYDDGCWGYKDMEEAATHYRRGGKKRRCYRIEETGGLVRLSKASLAGSELLSSAKGDASPVLAEFFAGRGSDDAPP